MSDNEKIIAKLQDAAAYFRSGFDAMYGTVACEKYRNWTDAIEQALALLKAQEPRLVTESDFDGADEYGYIPVWTEEKDGDMYWECIPKAAITDLDGIGALRYWTSRPDEKRRAETPWN